ncbi:MAG: 50S ribosomal protein L4 [SAR202 cluster bacterium]|nr:50S ribosomal protein L4 [SAR202 cluster bacterium]
METTVKNQQGQTVETITLDDAVFNVPLNHALVHQALVMYQANRRQGTHDTKTRAEVSGGGKKPWAQKHTGRARQGSTRAPQWRHGGVVFGPHPRSYRVDMPKRMRRLAIKCMLSEKARQGQLICVDQLQIEGGKTQAMASVLKNLGVSGSALVVTRQSDQQVARAAHNLEKVWTLPVNLLNAGELLKYGALVMTVDAARQAEQLWAVEPHGRRGAVKEGTPFRMKVRGPKKEKRGRASGNAEPAEASA